MVKNKIAVLLTCFNRKSQTLSCLHAIHSQNDVDDLEVNVVLVDDGSTDGTSEEVLKEFPNTKIIPGDGNLFWAGGMRVALNTSMVDDHDFFLWLNDDTILFPRALRRLVDSFFSSPIFERELQPIIVGSTKDPVTHKTTYGGVVIKHKWWPLKYELLPPAENTAIQCDTLNGNCVLIPRQVAFKLNGIDGAFTHYLADHDFGLRARTLGHKIWIAPGHFGSCESSKSERKNSGNKSDLNTQLKNLNSPKGLSIGDTDLTSFREWKIYSKRHGGLLWPIYWLAPYRRIMLSYFTLRSRK